MFGAFPENDHLCVVNCPRQYKSETQQHRRKESGMPQPLFLSYIKSNGSITSQCLAHWIKEILGKAGVDTCLQGPFSSRNRLKRKEY